ncbi:ATP-binding protein [Streptomyces sp. NPDC051563]|uniref:ATP-binding protein n=1 Tax=Streptomyces sp. NPDC051563 TaxID=3365659 RepID=UPI0037B6E486
MSAERTALRSPSAVAEARQAARRIDGLGRPAISAEGADTVILVVSELVTNALRHGGGTYTLRLTAHPDGIEVAVGDLSPHLPRARTPDLVDGTGGRIRLAHGQRPRRPRRRHTYPRGRQDRPRPPSPVARRARTPVGRVRPAAPVYGCFRWPYGVEQGVSTEEGVISCVW